MKTARVNTAVTSQQVRQQATQFGNLIVVYATVWPSCTGAPFARAVIQHSFSYFLAALDV
jgi:hypothetical protein